MPSDIPERDWKYVRSIQQDLLNELCARINGRSQQILSDTKRSEHEKYLVLYKYIHESDAVIGACVNDWRR